MTRSKTGSNRRGGGHQRLLFTHVYEDIISVENLLEAWKDFRKGKRNRLDVLEFQSDLIQQITSLHQELQAKTYRHGGYRHFRISDPKPRDIHKASVRDRLLHHALHRTLYPFFDKRFIADSYSCRVGKGTHKAMNRLHIFAHIISKNHTRTVWVLKCDIRKFFASIDHMVLKDILRECIADPNIGRLLEGVIDSFCSPHSLHDDTLTYSSMSVCPKGLPLGNLTSQLLVNIYMNEFDQFVKNGLKVRYYIRYADDFVILSADREELRSLCRHIGIFLRDRLRLELHPHKVFIRTLASGVDFLGWVHFPDHRVLRTVAKRRMFRKIREKKGNTQTLQSYLGLLRHGNTHTLREKMEGFLKTRC